MLNVIKEKLINEYRRRLNYLKQVIAVFLYNIEDYIDRRLQDSSNPIKENSLIDRANIIFVKEKI